MSASLELWPSTPRRAGPPTLWHRFRRKIAELPSGLLLFAQLGTLIIYPFLEDVSVGEFRTFGKALFGVVGLAVLFLAVRAVRATPALSWIASVIGIPVVLLTVAEAIWPTSQSVLFWSSLLHAVFYFYTGYALVRYMFADNWVTKDELYATGATFTVVAFGFAYLYTAVQVLYPHSFTIYGEAEPTVRSWYELLYLSIANMTGTGMSDIFAVTPYTRSFVTLQQITGMLYVALVVARLVGLTIARFRTNA